MSTFILQVPLPPAALTPNNPAGSIGQRMRRANAADAYKAEVEMLAFTQRRASGWMPPERASISLHFCTKPSRGDGRYRAKDWDNAVASFKAGQDALVAAGVLVADDTAHLVCGGVTFDHNSGPFVRVSIAAIGEQSGARIEVRGE